jgi:hypothetical protein
MLGIEANWAKNVVKDMQRSTSDGSYLNLPGFVEER